ncbi:MAG: LytTR family transcriptional regulator DNA-binding domain-containing protein, partial [Lachnospiraceae bacterium]|nr:LytTR family transcriptional regulator DNA-binding domain-containing protein [Lachnospiraceae bacterium]
FRYLIKPLQEDEVFQALSAASQMLEVRKKEAIIVTQSDKSRRVFMDDIYYIEVDNHHIILHLRDETIRFKAKLKELETQFKEPQFCKCHRSYIVNMKYAGRISREGVEIDGKKTLPISKSRWETLNHCYMEYYMV